MESLLCYGVLLIVLAIVTYLVYGLLSSGCLDAVEITVQTPALFSPGSNVVVLYKHFLGPYKHIGDISNDIVDILPSGQARLFTIYYDQREQHNSKSSQAVIGCIYEVDGNALFEKHFEYQLIRWGFEKMTLPRVEEAVNFRTHSAPGVFTTLLLNHKAYPMMRQVAQNLGAGDCTLSIEVLSDGAGGEGSLVDVIIPLDHLEDFIVPEHLSHAELHSKMDDNSSCASDVTAPESLSATASGEDEPGDN